MLPIRCTIPYSYETKRTLLELCVSAMRRFGETVEEHPEGNDWELRRPADLAAAAIKMANWIGWSTAYMGRDAITADTADLVAALGHLEEFADRRLYELGAQPCDGGDSGATKVIIAVPAEHVELVTHFFEARTLCQNLQRQVNAEIAGWMIDREQRDDLRPHVVQALTTGYRAALAALRRSEWSRARDCGSSCAALIAALDRLEWEADAPEDANTFGLPDRDVLARITPSSPAAQSLLALTRFTPAEA